VNRAKFSALAFVLLGWFLVLCPAQTSLLDDESFRRLVIQNLTRELRYAAYWDVGRLADYAAGRKVTLAALRNSHEFLVCIEELQRSTEGLVLGGTGGITGPRLAVVSAAHWQSGQGNCSEKISSFRHRNFKQTDFEQQRRLLEKNGLPVPEAPFAIQREEADRNISEAVFVWELPVLEPPDAYSRRTKPGAIEEVRQEVRRVAAKHRGADCGPGEALIPYFSDDDAWLFVWVRLGERCPDGVIDVMAGPEGRLSLGKLWMSEFDNDAVRRLIEPILLERLVLE
jgi:hypothetical protein